MKNETEKIDNQQGNVVLPCVSGSAYIVEVYGHENIVVLAENIDDACNKLDKAGILDYGFVYCKSFDVLS